MTEHLDALRSKLATEIPVTQHLGLEVVRLDDDGLLLAAPLAQNVNHEGTAFAGSVNAVATLAGWGWTWLSLRAGAREAHVVLQDSRIRYARPVERDFTAHCHPPQRSDLERLLLGLEKHGRGRISLAVDVAAGGTAVASFRGRYVALRQGT